MNDDDEIMQTIASIEEQALASQQAMHQAIEDLRSRLLAADKAVVNHLMETINEHRKRRSDIASEAARFLEDVTVRPHHTLPRRQRMEPIEYQDS